MVNSCRHSRLAFAACGILALGLIAGCGSGDNGRGYRFAGDWAGTEMTTITPATPRTMNITISADGSMTGLVTHTGFNRDGVLSGTVTDGGVFIATIVYPAYFGGGAETHTENGTVSIAANGHLTGTLQENWSQTQGTSTLDLTRQ